MAAGTDANIIVVGAGITGLTCALLLEEKGYSVTVVARNLPGDLTAEWASPWAAALLAAYPGGDPEMQRRSLLRWQALAQEKSQIGLHSIPIAEYYDSITEESAVWYRKFFKDFKFIDKHELPGKARIGFTYTTQIVNPLVYLPWLMDHLQHRGVKFIQKTVTSLEDTRLQTNASLVVNATGLGARLLANDDNVHGIRGQTMFVKGTLDHVVIFQGSEYTYAIPRPDSNGVILGGVSQPFATDTEPDAATKRDILRRVNELSDNAFGSVDTKSDDVQDIVAFRPARYGGIRVEQEGNVVHAYGVAGLGYLYAFGAAERVRDLVEGKVSEARVRL